MKKEAVKKMSILEKAEYLAMYYFKDKVDKGGNPYMEHLIAVSKDFDDPYVKSIALLHDILEDTEVTPEYLKSIGFDDNFINTLIVLTKTESDYNDYISRIIASQNIIAYRIKLKDLLNNMDLSRIKNITEKDIKRIHKKYIPSYYRIILAYGLLTIEEENKLKLEDKK